MYGQSELPTLHTSSSSMSCHDKKCDKYTDKKTRNRQTEKVKTDDPLNRQYHWIAEGSSPIYINIAIRDRFPVWTIKLAATVWYGNQL